jgi:dGTPase
MRLRRQAALLKQLTKNYVINNPALTTHQFGQRQIIRQLFSVYLERLTDGDFSVFPRSIRGDAEMPSSDRERARFVCDAIAAMSEVTVIHAHARLTGTHLGPLEDPAIS